MVKLTVEDKQQFKSELRKATPEEVLVVAKFIKDASLSVQDKKFCYSCIGQRCERLLRNVATGFSFEDGKE